MNPLAELLCRAEAADDEDMSEAASVALHQMQNPPGDKANHQAEQYGEWSAGCHQLQRRVQGQGVSRHDARRERACHHDHHAGPNDRTRFVQSNADPITPIPTAHGDRGGPDDQAHKAEQRDHMRPPRQGVADRCRDGCGDTADQCIGARDQYEIPPTPRRKTLGRRDGGSGIRPRRKLIIACQVEVLEAYCRRVVQEVDSLADAES